MIIGIGPKFYSALSPSPPPYYVEIKVMDLEIYVKVLPPASALASALTKMFKFYVKVFKTLYFLNPQMELLYIWYDYRYWSRILFSTIPTLWPWGLGHAT